jgi:hypothetical protein
MAGPQPDIVAEKIGEQSENRIHFRSLQAKASVLSRLHQIRVDRRFTQPLRGFQPMQALDEHMALAVVRTWIGIFMPFSRMSSARWRTVSGCNVLRRAVGT